MRFAVIAFLASLTVLPAQQGGDKERLIFPPGAVKPVASATPTPTPRKAESPTEAIEEFFRALKAGQIDMAYETLVRVSLIADRPEDVASLKKRTREALDNYGPISGYETLDEKAVGSSLLRRTCISLNSDLPLRWRFYFYRSENEWRLVDLRVDDGLVELFDEPSRARK